MYHLQAARQSRLLLTVVILVSLPQLNIAKDNDLYISGFASQGFIVSSDNAYRVENSVEGSFEFNEAVVSIQANPSDRLRVGIQFMSWDLGDEGNNQVMIDWAGADYRWRDDLGFRAGKIKMPMGLYNQGRDIDMLRTCILLPSSVYQEDQRDFVLALEGVSIYGNKPLCYAGHLDYELYCGTLNIPDPSRGFWGDIYASSGESTRRGLKEYFSDQTGIGQDSIAVELATIENEKVTFPVVYGSAFVWNTPLNGLRLGSSWFIGEFDMAGDWEYQIAITDTSGHADSRIEILHWEQEFDIDRMWIASAEFTYDRLRAVAEYSSGMIDNGTGTGRDEGYYGQLSYRFTDWLTAASYYSIYYEDANDRSGRHFRSDGWPEYVGWAKDLSCATRFDLTPNWLMKAEFHYVDGLAQLSIADHIPLLRHNKLERYWTALVLKTTVHF